MKDGHLRLKSGAQVIPRILAGEGGAEIAAQIVIHPLPGVSAVAVYTIDYAKGVVQRSVQRRGAHQRTQVRNRLGQRHLLRHLLRQPQRLLFQFVHDGDGVAVFAVIRGGLAKLGIEPPKRLQTHWMRHDLAREGPEIHEQDRTPAIGHLPGAVTGAQPHVAVERLLNDHRPELERLAGLLVGEIRLHFQNADIALHRGLPSQVAKYRFRL